jgi:hypothetical protein
MTMGTFVILFEIIKTLTMAALFALVFVKNKKIYAMALFSLAYSPVALLCWWVIVKTGRFNSFCNNESWHHNGSFFDGRVSVSDCDLSIGGAIYEHLFSDLLLFPISGLPMLILVLCLLLVIPVRTGRIIFRSRT